MSFFPQTEVDYVGGNWEHLTVDIGDAGLLLQLAAKAQVLKHLENECDRQEEFWSHRVVELADALNIDMVPPVIMRVDPDNVYTGARPSLLLAPVEFWPSVTIRCGELRPARLESDQIDEFNCDLFFEIMCYAGPVKPEQTRLKPGIEAEGAVDVQVHLLSNAVQMCVSRDPTFGGVCASIQAAPTIRPSFPTVTRGNNQERIGDSYFYQGRQIRYVVTRRSF